MKVFYTDSRGEIAKGTMDSSADVFDILGRPVKAADGYCTQAEAQIHQREDIGFHLAIIEAQEADLLARKLVLKRKLDVL